MQVIINENFHAGYNSIFTGQELAEQRRAAISLAVNKPARTDGKRLLKKRQQETLRNWKESNR